MKKIQHFVVRPKVYPLTEKQQELLAVFTPEWQALRADTIRERTSYASNNAVHKATKILERRGLIDIGSAKGGGKKVNNYRLHSDRVEDQEVKPHPLAVGKYERDPFNP